jgi:O-antigen/teichoic acid export membrane protein
MFRTSLASKLSLLDQMIVSGSNLALGLVLVRWGGLELYGVYSLCFLGVMLAMSLQQALILTPMMSIGPKMQGAAQLQYFRDAFSLQLLFSLGAGGVAVVALGLAPFLNWEVPLSLLLYLPAMLFQGFFRRFHYQQEESRKALYSDAIAYGGWLLAALLWGLQGSFSLNTVYALGAGSFGLATAYSLLQAHGSSLFEKKGDWKAIWPRHWQQARWLSSAALLQFFSGNYFLIAAASLLGAGAAGAVRMVQSLMGGIHVLFHAMENVVPVRAAAAWQRDGGQGLKAYLLKSSLKMGAFLLLALLGLAIFGEPLLSIAYGAEASSAFGLLLPFCLLYLFIFPGYPLRFALRAMERTQPVLWAYVLSTGFSLLAAEPFLSALGLPGVAYGMLCAQLIMQLVYGLSLKIMLTKKYPAI